MPILGSFGAGSGKGFGLTSGGAPDFICASGANPWWKFGDYASAGNDTFFSGSDNTGEMRLASVGVVTIGDQHGRTNGTYVSVDDVNEIIRVQAEGNVVIGDDDWASYGSGTHLVVDDDNQTISASATKNIVIAGTGTNTDLRADGDGAVTFATSDVRLKKDINEISESIDIIKSLSGITYKWKSVEEGNPRNTSGHDKTYFGLVAQEVTGSRAHGITFEQKDGYLGVNLTEVVPILINAVKELEERVKELENK